MYIDLETGTVVNGPIVYVNDDAYYQPPMEGSDSEIIEWASEWGIPVSVSTMEE